MSEDIVKESIKCLANMEIKETTYQVARSVVLEEIERLNKEVEKYKKRCYEALTLIRENYGLLDKYGIDMLDDILNGR